MSTPDPVPSPTTVTLTGTGVPHPSPGRAGAGALVRRGSVALQFDAGRGTVIRLAEAGTPPHALTALFVTHVHSDHLTDLADVVMTRWVQQQLHRTGPLVVYAVQGVAERFVRRMLDAYEDDIRIRMEHVGSERPGLDVRVFAPPSSPTTVWVSDDGAVRVEATCVRHDPVPEAVAYRVTTPEGVVVISGDTRVCEEVESFATGADVLVHEACRATAMRELIRGTVFETIFSYHADTVALGALAQRCGVPHVVLTHLIPPPADERESAGFAEDLRAGGYDGRVSVGTDLLTVPVGRASR